MKAIALFSGGLDSQLAIKLILNQGIEVEGVNFTSPFFGGKGLDRVAEDLGIAFTSLDISEEYMAVLKNPRYGYGKNMNPCIDCHAFMIKKAGEYMERVGAKFIITGEVLGQRPMSQNRSALNAVDKLSGYRGLVLRPLSAKLLPETIPEIQGWVDRRGLLDIQGRSRQRQMELAEQFGLTEYPSPAGGCLLTVEGYASRLKKLLAVKPEAGPEDAELLKHGRFFVSDWLSILIIGRKQEENEKLLRIALPSDYLIKVKTHPGPVGLLRSPSIPSTEEFIWASSLVARYSDAKDEKKAVVKISTPCGDCVTLDVRPMPAY